MRMAQAAQKAVTTPLAFNLMHRRCLDRLLETDPLPGPDPLQLALQWNPS